ncbi:nucleic acid-binding protein [Natrinema sp. SYSU A 869]|uniref:nucleic acid-binding protein n=1 Tax=Natrinema sp. SYSU A 869 TaxID=2871694 RepID=UPI001CA3A5B1|nr:nucleic acid-binding protein [Natrinema sp. SYSU A 869]
MTMEATRYDDGSISYPGHPRGPGGSEPVETIDLSKYTAEIVTWTTSTATPPGVREPNHLAIVEFDVSEAQRALEGQTESDGEREPVRAIGQLTTGDVETGDEVRPVSVDELREPGAGIREPESQEWDGYRLEPV